MIHCITSKERTSIEKPKLDNKLYEGLCLQVKTDSHQNLKILYIGKMPGFSQFFL